MNQLMLFCIFSCFAFNVHCATFKVAAVEFNPKLLEFKKNLEGIYELTEQTAKQGAKIIVLPEMATTGLNYQDRAQITPFLDTIPGKKPRAFFKRSQNIITVILLLASLKSTLKVN